MDEKDLAKAGVEVALRPFTDVVADVVGLAGGDWIRERRIRNRARLAAETQKIAKERGTKLDPDASPSVIEPIITAAQDEGRDELIRMWAGLTATALDPNRSKQYRREFVEIAKQLEPSDVLVLPELLQTAEMQPSRREFIAPRVNLNPRQVGLSFRALQRLDLIAPPLDEITNIHRQPSLTELGHEFLAAVKGQ